MLRKRKEKEQKKTKVESFWTAEESQDIWAAPTPEEAHEKIFKRRPISEDTIMEALLSRTKDKVLTLVVDMDNKTARLIKQNNVVANRKTKEKNVNRLELARQEGQYKINGDAGVLFHGLPLDCGHRLEMAANMPDGETVPMIFLINPPILDVREAVLTSTSAAPKSDSDRNSIFSAGKLNYASTELIAKRHFSLVENMVVAANQYALPLKIHLQKNKELLNKWAAIVFDAATSSVKKGNQFSEDAKQFGGTTRLAMLAATAAFIDELVDEPNKSKLEKYVLGLIGKEKFPASHVTEILRLTLNNLINTKSKKSIGRDARNPETFMRWLMEGFLWSLAFDATGNYPYTKGTTAASGDWTGIKSDDRRKDDERRTTSYSVNFSITAKDEPKTWLMDALKKIPSTVDTEGFTTAN